jgi:predicted nucleic acid-binding protein
VGGAATLVTAVRSSGRGAFVADTAPIIYRIERGVSAELVGTVDPLFDAVERGGLGCLVSAVSVAELLIKPQRTGPRAVAAVDTFLGQPAVGVAEVDEGVARQAAGLVADGRLRRLADALIAATALAFELPIVTSDRRLARSGVPNVFLVADFA